jgi:hypothetical protein
MERSKPVEIIGMKNDPHLFYFKFYGNTWLSSMSKIQLCTHEQKGIFIDICAYCLVGNGWTDNDEFLAERLRVEKGSLSEALGRLLKLKLLVSDSSKLGVKFILKMLEEEKRRKKEASENGKKGGRPKRVGKGSSQEQVQEQVQEQEIEKKELSCESFKENAAPTLGIFKDPELKTLFDSFVSHVSEVKRKPSGAQMDAWQRQCSDMGKAKAIAALNNSINKGLAFIAEPFVDRNADSSPMVEF